MSSYFDIVKQFTFYGSYHNNPVNFRIHLICVPLLIWSFQVIAFHLSFQNVIPSFQLTLPNDFVFNLNLGLAQAVGFHLYYFALDPVAAFLYLPVAIFSQFAARLLAQHDNAVEIAGIIHAAAWAAQFFGHGVHEKRAPALLDNIIQAVVLAPFFVHLEVLFAWGYRPELHKTLVNDIGKEIARYRKEEGNKSRAPKN